VANRLGIRKGELPSTFVTQVDLRNIVKVAGFEIVRSRLAVYCPWKLLGLGDVINRVLPLVPLVRWFSLTYIVVLRPLGRQSRPGISCIIPARNERGNIENALKRFPDLGCETEIVFVEGHSNDGTWEEIQRVRCALWRPLSNSSVATNRKRQSGRRKTRFFSCDPASPRHPRCGPHHAPEMLGRFYEAYCHGFGDFINGSRLVYPMEGDAMRLLATRTIGLPFELACKDRILTTELVL
jgi:hypothetical protein